MIASWLLFLLHLAAAPDARDNRIPSDEPFVAASHRIDDGWLGFTMPLAGPTEAACCWHRRSDGLTSYGCDLEDGDHGFVSGTPKVPASDRADVFIEVRDGSPVRLVIVGSECPVRGGGPTIPWVTPAATLELLDEFSRAAGGEVAHTAIYGIAVHAGQDATRRLTEIAKAEGPRRNREQATFWLGAARGEAGVEALAALLRALPHGEVRTHIAVALAQSDTPAAARLLAELARRDGDDRMRTQALFWLAEGGHPETEQIATEILAGGTHEALLDGALFALAQLPDERATPALLAVVRSDQARSLRQRAIFWLARSDDPTAIEALTALVTPAATQR